MESSADKYLHKKFKKQLNVEPKNQNNDKETKASLPRIQDKNAAQAPQGNSTGPRLPTEQCSNTSEDHPRIDNKECVPNKSTNQNSLSVQTPPYASSFHRSSISKIEELSDKSKELTNPQSTTSCISYVISKNSRVADPSQLDPQIRSVNFDTKCNVTEPISNTVAESSSILENVNFRQNYVSSKLVSLEKEDISSAQPERDRFHEERSFLLEKPPDRKSETAENSSLPDKTSGGKHVCPYCNLACSKPSVLQKHIRAHTNERPYPCVSCGFSFKTRSNLYKHCRSRTHANRVMGNKAQEVNNEIEIDKEYCEQKSPLNQHEDQSGQAETSDGEKSTQEFKSKPYKPRFHTAKAFFDSVTKENVSSDNEKSVESPHDIRHTKDLLSLHINELIHKNNSIVNSTDPFLLKRRSIDNSASDGNNETSQRLRENAYTASSAAEQRNSDEPLNLTNKNRKRCMSEVTEPATQRSLIKELLLKNLYADSNMQCPYCRMLFQTVTELELHKFRSCKGFTKSGARYSRSSSVNVASILTQNKNAFDNIPHLHNAVFPLKSPGPFLGKTRLVESDKSKSFSFDDNLPSTFQNSPNDLLKTSHRYSLSPLTVQYDREKKAPVKLFGGEVKITHTTGETKSFKIDSKESEKYTDSSYAEYGGKLSESCVVKSTLQSGGTVLTNKPQYNKQESLRTSPDVIRVYENASASPNVDAGNSEKTKFNFNSHGAHETSRERDRPFQHNLLFQPATTNLSSIPISPFRYTSIMDFSQNAAKLLVPNLKQLNLSIPGIPQPNKAVFPVSPVASKHEKIYEPTALRMEVDAEDVVPNYSVMENIKNIKFAEKQILMQQRMTVEPPATQQSPFYNPMNLYVNGKVVRYVPGIPGPVAAAEDVYPNVTNANHVSPGARSQKTSIVSPFENSRQSSPIFSFHKDNPNTERTRPEVRTPNSSISDRQSKSPKTETTEGKTDLAPKINDQKSLSIKTSGDLQTPEKKSPNHLLAPSTNESRKFARPNSLALKPSLASIKQHHGLTPTMFNQVLISPDTPRVAKKYNQHMMHGNYFSYLGLKSSTKSVYCTLNKTQPVYVPHFKKLSMYSEWRQQDHKSEKLYVSAYESRQKDQKFTTAGKTSADFIVHSSYKVSALYSIQLLCCLNVLELAGFIPV